MKLGFILLFVSLLIGQLGAISLAPGVVIYFHDIVLFILFCFGFATKKAFVRPKLLRPIVFFAGVGLVSLLVNFSRFTPWQVGLSSLYLVRWAGYALIYLMIVQIPKIRTFLLRGLYVTGTVFSLLGLVQFVLYPSLRNLWYLGWDPHYYRLFSTFLDPNFAGLFIVLTFLLGVRLRNNWIFQGVNLLALYLTYSRSSYLALLVAGIVWIIKEKKWKALWVVALIVSLVIFIPRPGGDTLRLLREDSTISRVENWQESLQLAGKSPIIGLGFNTLPSLHGNPVSKAAAGVDNSFLFLLATTGIVGLGMHIVLLWRMRNIAILSAVIVHSQFINSLFYPWIMLWLWIYLGARETSDDR